MAENVIMVEIQQPLRLPGAVLLRGTDRYPQEEGSERWRVEQKRGLEASNHQLSVFRKSKQSYEIQTSMGELQ